MQYIIRTDQPFSGSVQSVLSAAGIVAYTDGLTLEQYAQERGFPVRAIDEAELDAMLSTYGDGLVTEPTEETLDAFEDALNVMPPSRWQRVNGVEMFHICERITLDLVSWHARRGDRFFTFTDRASRPAIDIARKVNAA